MSDERFWRGQRVAVWVMFIWATATYWMGYSGQFEGLPTWAFPLIVVTGVFAPFLAYLYNSKVQEFIGAIPMKHLTLFHFWRIGAGLYFLHLGDQGQLPETFVRNAGYGDVLVGLAVLPLISFPESRRNYLIFHIFSLLDFIVAVGTGLTFTVLRIPLMENIQKFPVALIPAFGVGVTGALSLMALHRLIRKPAQ